MKFILLLLSTSAMADTWIPNVGGDLLSLNIIQYQDQASCQTKSSMTCIDLTTFKAAHDARVARIKAACATQTNQVVQDICNLVVEGK